MTLDRNVPIPLYYQLYMLLESQITKGSYKPGDYFSTEMELQDKYNVSRATIRNALEMLESNGYILRVTGRGIFIATAKLKIDLPELLSFSEEMKKRRMKASSRLLSVELMEPSLAVREALQLKDGEQVLSIRRIRYGNEIPILYSETHVPGSLSITTKDDLLGSLYEWIQNKTGRMIEEARHTIEGAVLDTELAELLEAPEGFPALRFRRIGYDSELIPLVFESGTIRADQYSYEIRLKRKQDG